LIHRCWMMSSAVDCKTCDRDDSSILEFFDAGRCPECGWGIGHALVMLTYPFALTWLCLVLVLIPVWIMNDASFNSTRIVFITDLGFDTGYPEIPMASTILEHLHEWSVLGERLFAMFAIAAITALVSPTLLLRPLIGKRRRTHAAILATLLVICGSSRSSVRRL